VSIKTFCDKCDKDVTATGTFDTYRIIDSDDNLSGSPVHICADCIGEVLAQFRSPFKEAE